jgi:hypothetical protein
MLTLVLSGVGCRALLIAILRQGVTAVKLLQ